MHVLFGARDVLDLVNNDYVALPKNATDVQRNAQRDLRKNDHKVLFYIHHYVDVNVFEKITYSTMTKAVSCKVAWIEMLLEELKIMEPRKMKLFDDNKPTIDLVNHSVCHGRSKHIERMYHFLKHCKTKQQLADILTKPLKKVRFDELQKNIGMKSLESMN